MAMLPQALSNLIGSIYDCALDPSRWEPTLTEIAEAFDGETVNLSLNDLYRDRLLIEKSVGWGQQWLEEREKHIPEIHARLSEWLALGPSLDQPFVASRQLAPSYLENSAYVRACLKPRGIADIMHYFLMVTPGRFSELVVSRHERQGLITDREIEIGELLLPHLRRAVTISNVLDVRTIERARMAEALDALRCAVVLTSDSGRVLHANRAAEEMLHDGAFVESAGGLLQAKAPAAAAAELRAAIALAAKDASQIGKTGLAIRLGGPDAPAVFAHVLPIGAGDLRSWLRPAAVAAIFIAPLDKQDSAQMMAAAFSLTPAETRVLASLLAGRTLAETAATLAIAASTARTHLDRIFAKTGVPRQAELVRLATQAFPPTASKS